MNAPTAKPIPGTIQAEDYDAGGEGISYHDTTAGNIEAGNHTLGETHAQAFPSALSAAACAVLSSSVPS